MKQQTGPQRVMALEDLAVYAARCKANGQTIGLCHGVFDLMHFGHVRHLQDAAGRVDVLFATVTDDSFVNKGPSRPVFASAIRAEMLAALECVRGVAVTIAPTAVPAIQQIKPDLYFKGIEYQTPAHDPTGQIIAEQDAVTKIGGQIAFTDDVVFSSTELINRYFSPHAPDVQTALASLRQNKALAAVEDVLEAMKSLKILLIGDTIIDEYRYVNPLGKATKDNILASHYERSEIYAGGVIAIANNLAAFCQQIDVITTVGDQTNLGDQTVLDQLIQTTLKSNVSLTRLPRSGVPTTHKIRYVEAGFNRKLFEVYDFDDRPLSYESPLRQTLHDKIQTAHTYDMVVAADFGHGLIDSQTARILEHHAPFLAVNTQTNAGNRGYNLATKYHRCHFLSLDAPEAHLTVGDKHMGHRHMVTKALPDLIDCPTILVTLGRSGCILYDRTQVFDAEKDVEKICEMPALTSQVVDRIGAGDALFALSAPAVFCRARPEISTFLGNLAGALKIGVVGHRSGLDRVSLLRAARALLS